MRPRNVPFYVTTLTLALALGSACSDDGSATGGGSSEGGAGGGSTTVGQGGDGGPGGQGGQEVTPDLDIVDVRMAMRGLFEDRVVWTRAYVIDSVDELPGRGASAARLLQNGDDFGAAIVPFYGEAAGNQLAALMNGAVGHAAEALDAAIADDMEAFGAARDDWYGSAEEVAAFLAAANPAWVEADVASLLKTCIDAAIEEAMGRMQGNMTDELAAFEQHKATSFTVADALATGIADQFPAMVGKKGTPAKQEELRVAMASLFFDRASFVRFFLTDAIEGLDSQSATVARLMQNNADISDAMVPFYGAPAGAQLNELLDAGLMDAVAAVEAALANDPTAFEAAKNAWYGHADDTATFLAGANPSWPVADLKTMLRGCVDHALAEASARMADDWVADAAAHDTLRAQARVVAHALAVGVATQFP